LGSLQHCRFSNKLLYKHWFQEGKLLKEISKQHWSQEGRFSKEISDKHWSLDSIGETLPFQNTPVNLSLLYGIECVTRLGRHSFIDGKLATIKETNIN
jgi:hypothetical protein